MIEVKAFSVGTLGTNCYVVIDKFTSSAAVVDPGGSNINLTAALDSLGKENIRYILLTHGHYDHIACALQLSEKYGADIVISSDDEKFLSDVNLNLAHFLGCMDFIPFSADITLFDGDVLALGDTELSFMHTPGHTVGSGCFIFEKDRLIFSGDTLFCGSMGRTDFPTGEPFEMLRSLKKLRDLGGDYKVYPGHNQATTLQFERDNNYYMR